MLQGKLDSFLIKQHLKVYFDLEPKKTQYLTSKIVHMRDLLISKLASLLLIC